MSRTSRFIAAVVAVLAIVGAACTGEDAAGTSPTNADGGATTPTAVTPTTFAAVTTTTAPPTTTTTEPEPEPAPAGVWWSDGIDVGVFPSGDNRVSGLEVVGGDLWLFGKVANGSFLRRSGDGGRTWTVIEIESPPADGAYEMEGILQRPGGGYLAWGSLGTRCQIGDDVGEGYRWFQNCRRTRPIVHVSDDGDTWRRVDAPTPPGGSELSVAGVVSHGDGLLMAATVKGPDWHGRVYESADGETWELAREFRADYPMSLQLMLSDGDGIVLAAEDHPCSRQRDTAETGWYLGISPVRWDRIYEGTSVDTLAISEDHPFNRPLEYDCTASTFEVVKTPTGIGAVDGLTIDGTMTLYNSIGLLGDLEPDPETGGSRMWARYVSGGWEVTTVTGVPVADRSTGHESVDLFAVDGMPGLLERRNDSAILVTPWLIVPGSDGEPGPVPGGRSLEAGELFEAAWVDGAFVVAGTYRIDPFIAPATVRDFPRGVRVWRSEPGFDPVEGRCVLEPGANCRFADLTTADGYPDFAGLDLRGIDLSFAMLGDADFSGADLSGARMWEADSGFDVSFAGARFDGAELPGARVRHAPGASFVGADLSKARLGDVTGADLTDADLWFADLAFVTWPTITTSDLAWVIITVLRDDSGTVPFEIDLGGFDLTRSKIQADTRAKLDGHLLVVTDLTGAILEQTTFNGVDLSRIDPATIDVAEMRVYEGSICPDGGPPDDPPIGTCDRIPGG